MVEKILSILEKICDDDAVREDMDMDLFEEGLMDSLSTVELIVAIEDEFGIVLSPTEYDKDELGTVNKILCILKEKGIQ